MQVNFNLTNLFRFARVSQAGPQDQQLSPLTALTPHDITQRNINQRRVSHINAALNDLDQLLARANTRPKLGTAKAISRSPLGLASIPTATTFNSVEQVNTAATSYTPFGPIFTGSGLSDALPEISGVYDGSNGNDTLRFMVTRTGVHGQSRIDVKVYDSAGDRINTIKIQPGDDPDQQYDVGNGLLFSLGPGTLIKNDDFYMDVFANTPTAVRADKAFNGTHDERPDFDPGLSVTAGSFEINGETIVVNADDSINSVVQRINDSDADVTASFDAVSETVQISRRLLGSAYDIVFANDTSGFLAAVKLSGNATSGDDQEADIALAQTQKFAAVTSGNLSINGNSIAFDVNTDSLNDIVQRINDAEINVEAKLVNNGQRVLVRGTIAGMPVELDDNGTQLFDALDIAEKRYKARGARNGFSQRQSRLIMDSLQKSVRLINEVFDPRDNPGIATADLTGLRDGIVAALRGTAPDGTTRFGISFAPDSPVRRDFIDVNRRTLAQQQVRNGTAVGGYLSGFAASIRGALSAYQAQFAAPESGAMVNARA